MRPALTRAVPRKRRRELAQAQQLAFAPYWRALLVRQSTRGSLYDLQPALVYNTSNGWFCIIFNRAKFLESYEFELSSNPSEKK